MASERQLQREPQVLEGNDEVPRQPAERRDPYTPTPAPTPAPTSTPPAATPTRMPTPPTPTPRKTPKSKPTPTPTPSPLADIDVISRLGSSPI
jgi:hypothetical protein